MKLSEAERIAYSRYSDDLHYQASMVESSYGLDKLEGREEGREDKNIKLFRPRLLMRTHIVPAFFLGHACQVNHHFCKDNCMKSRS
ncbi:MAG TPA: hypothetical protein PLK58_11980 [Candidatus Rifleibacterium sp.]|nr:hypothetical protein [Candidatus Rifleibacterium sp.]